LIGIEQEKIRSELESSKIEAGIQKELDKKER
jgi:hypothetical protein